MATAATLSSGIKSVHLSLDTPVDVNTGKVRNDLSGVRVWYSTNPTFNPVNSEGELAFNGLSLDITIPNLQENTEYYTRHAFISAIDPNTFTISQPLSAKTYDENTTVYGNLTNPTSFINTNSDGTGGQYTYSTGVFRVYKYSQEVTGSQVIYAAESGSVVGGLQYTLNPATGEYQVTGQTDDYASVILTATYDGVTIQATLVAIRVRKGVDGTTARQLTLSADGNVFVFKDSSATASDTAQVTVRAAIQNFTGVLVWTAKAYTPNGALLGDVTVSQPDNLTLVLTGENFNPTAFNNTVGYVIVTATFGALVTDSFTIYRINNGTEQLTIELTNDTDVIPAYYDETVVESGYIGSGTEIRVREGNQYLTVDNNAPYAPGTWTVTSTNGVYITPDQTPTIYGNYISYGDHSNMTAIRAYIDYTVSGTTTSGNAFTLTKRQSFTKSVAGAPGFTATVVRLTCDSLVFIKFKDGTYSSSTVNIFADAQNVTQPIYTWDDGINPPVVKDSTSDPTANQYQFPRPANLGNYNITVTVTSKNNPALNTAVDSITIAYIEEGTDAFTFLFKDPNIVLSANNQGVVENAITSVTNHIIGARGIALLEAGAGKDIVYTVDSTENCTAVMGNIVNLWNHEFTISGAIFNSATISNAKVVIKCQVPNGGPSFLQTCYIAKVKKGDTGANGSPAVTVDLVSEADVVSALADGTGYTLPSGNQINLYSGGTLVTNGVNYGGTATKNGLTLTVNQTTGAVTLSGTGWTSNQESFTLTATYNGTTYTAQYIISKSRAGSDAVFVDLLSEADVVAAASDGTGYTLPTGNSLRVFKGGAQLTSGVTYSGTATQNGLTLTIDAGTGAITLSGASWTSTQETFTLTATYSGTNYTYRYKIAKSRQGTAGVGGINTATVALYAKNTSSSSAPAAFSGTFTYTFSTSSLSGGTLNGWSTTAPSVGNGEYLWVRYATASSNTSTDSIAEAEFSGAAVLSVGGVNGTNGINTATVALYAKNTSSSSAPAAFSGTFTYTFSTSSLSGGTLNGWSTTAPSITNGEYLWVRYATAASNTATDTIASTEFSTAAVLSVGGVNGATGATGPQGPAGANGTNGSNGLRTANGYIYQTTTGGASSVSGLAYYDFNSNTLYNISPWSSTVTFVATQNNYARYWTVTEASPGAGYGYITVSSAFTHTSFSGLVTFTALGGSEGNTTFIDGGKIISGSLTVDKIQAGTSTTSNGATFGFGTGSVIAGISTAGFFKSTSGSVLGLGVLSSSNTAFSASTVYSGIAGGFGNRNGYGIDDLSSGYNRTIAAFSSYNQAGFFQIRNQTGSVNNTSAGMTSDTQTQSSVRLCFTDDNGSTYFAAQLRNNTSGYTVNAGANNTSLYAYQSGGSSTMSIVSGNYCFFGAGQGYASGDITAASFTPSSSRRYKENIAPIDIGLNFILGLTPVKYTLKSNKRDIVGFIAEDFPDQRFVHTAPIDITDESKGFQIDSLNYTGLIAPLVKAVQELNQKVQELQTEIATLKTQN